MPLGAGPFLAVVLLSDVGPNGIYSLLNGLADYLTLQELTVLRLDATEAGTAPPPWPAPIRVENSSPMPNQH